MKVYLVIGTLRDPQLCDEPAICIYGVFSTRAMAERIAADICPSMDESHVGIEELILDETTEDYDLEMSI